MPNYKVITRTLTQRSADHYFSDRKQAEDFAKDLIRRGEAIVADVYIKNGWKYDWTYSYGQKREEKTPL